MKLSDLTIDPYRTADNAELITTLPVPTTGGSYYAIYQVPIGSYDIQPYELLDVSGQLQVTNTMSPGENVGVSHKLVLTNQPVTVPGAPDLGCTGLILIDAAGENITPNPGVHHGVRTLAAKYQFPEDVTAWAGYRWVTLAARAYSSAADPGDTATVDRNGRLDVVRVAGTPAPF